MSTETQNCLVGDTGFYVFSLLNHNRVNQEKTMVWPGS